MGADLSTTSFTSIKASASQATRASAEPFGRLWRSRRLSPFAELHAKTFYVLASRATHRAVFFTDCKEAFKEAVLRPGERVAVWDYENGAGPDSQKIAAQVDDEERYAAAEARDEGTMFHAGEEDLQAFWNLQREAPDLQKIATQAQHTMKPNQEREIGNERHY